jgi:hypothetical protein
VTRTGTHAGACDGAGALGAETDLCRAAVGDVWGACGTQCQRFFKRDDNGEPVNIQCVRDNKRSTTAIGVPVRTPGVDAMGAGICTISCGATIVCVCDP